MNEREAAKLRAIVEAILLAAANPVSPGRLQEVLREVNGRQLRQAIDELRAQYDEQGRAFTIVEVAGGFQLATRREYAPWVRKFHHRKQIRLSPAALEVLAIIAFKQPITRVEIDNIRGVQSDGVLRTLMELELVRLVGRSEGIGKPYLFGTTRDFLIHFGLRSLADLPKRRELEELLAAGERKAQQRAQEEEEAHSPAGQDEKDTLESHALRSERDARAELAAAAHRPA